MEMFYHSYLIPPQRQFNKSDLRRACAISIQAMFGLLQVVEPQRIDRILNDLHLVSIVQMVTTVVFHLSPSDGVVPNLKRYCNRLAINKAMRSDLRRFRLADSCMQLLVSRAQQMA